MSSKAWKNHERTTAEVLGGKRVSRGADFGESAPDIEHPIFSIECKYRKKLSSFLKEGLDQARSYSTTKTPILVLRERGTHGAMVVMELKDFALHMGSIGGSEDESDCA